MTETRSDHSPPPPAITAEMRMADAVQRNPDLPVVLMRFHIGGCSLCGFEPEDTVAQVAEDNGVPLSELLEAMNAPR